MTTQPLKWLPILTFVSSLILSGAQADDMARDIREGKGSATSEDGGYLELGLGLVLYDFPIEGWTEDTSGGSLELLLNGRYQWHGLFAEAIAETERGLTLGYNVGVGDRWVLDIIGSNMHMEISEDFDDDLQGLRDRKLDFMLGLRSSFYRGDNIAQLELLGDVSGVHDGFVASLSLGRYWQVRNWNLHSIVSIRHRSENVVDYYLGVRPDEASERFPAFDGKAGNETGLELGVTYPVNEKWIFRSTANYYYLDDDLADSPLAVDNDGATWLTSITRVFY